MRKQGRHIRYLKLIVEFIVNNSSIIGIALILFLLFSHSNQLSLMGIALFNKINNSFFSDIDIQNYQIVCNFMAKWINAIFSLLVSICINKLIYIFVKKKRYTVRLRRHIYNKLRKHYIISDKWITHTIIPKLINVFLHGKPLNYYNQSDHIKQLMKYLGVDNAANRHIVWIKGDAYTGKTTIIFRFIEELTNKKNFKLFEEYEKHIYYFDLGAPSIDVSNLHKSISNRRYENALLILDNIHKLELADLRILVTTLENCHNNVKFLICLSRQYEEFCYSQEIYERLDNFTHNCAVELNINPLNDNETLIVNADDNLINEIFANTKDKEENYQRFCKRIIKEGQEINLALIVQCYNLYLSTPGSRNRTILYIVFDSLNTGKGSIPLKYTLSFIIHATLFSGGFEASWFYEFINSINDNKISYYAKRYFRLLQKSSFISIVWSSNYNEVAFHEKLARYYFELIDKHTNYMEINTLVIEYLSKKNEECGRISNAWKYRTLLLPKTPKDSVLFDKSLCVANFKVLLEDLQYIIKVKHYNESLFYRELGILFDRSGKLDRASMYFKKALKHFFDPTIYINLIQVDHGEFDEKTIFPLLLNKNDAYIRVAAKYWKAHIDIHDGKFQFEEFSELLEEWKNYKDLILKLHPYDGLHLMRRWYFDCFRVYYLSGILNPDFLKPIISANLFKDINFLPEFEAFRYKFQCAFFLHYDVLFDRGIRNILDFEKFKKWDKIMLNQSFYPKLIAAKEQGKSEIDVIVKEAIKYYTASSDGLKKIMDKSYRYSDLRVWELKLAYDHVTYDDIFMNERYIKDYIQHSLSIHIDEYVAYGYTYLLKNYLVGQYCLAQEYDDNPYSGRILKNTYITDELIQDCIINIERYHNSYRGQRKNSYCLFRLDIYKTLYNYMKNNLELDQTKERIQRLKSIAKKKGYRREKILLEHLLDRNLTRIDIIKFYKYYPLVMQ